MLRLPNGQAWLIDCGRQAPDQLWARGLTWWSIDGQIITHVHGDHAYGLEDFALMRY
jgi:ribonuclease BN (tRNA processing enzyme)